jgi:hypothetical protein
MLSRLPVPPGIRRERGQWPFRLGSMRDRVKTGREPQCRRRCAHRTICGVLRTHAGSNQCEQPGRRTKLSRVSEKPRKPHLRYPCRSLAACAPPGQSIRYCVDGPVASRQGPFRHFIFLLSLHGTKRTSRRTLEMSASDDLSRRDKNGRGPERSIRRRALFTYLNLSRLGCRPPSFVSK